MSQKRTYKRYSKEFKEEVVSLVLDQGYSVAKAAESVGVKPSLAYVWKDKIGSGKVEQSLDVNTPPALAGGVFTDSEGLKQHHERSRFSKVGNRWYYVDGEFPRPETYRAENKVGRNDPCPCGSGKKFKKCCG